MSIKTPWNKINKLLNGGLQGSQVGVISAPAGSGKSWMLQNIAAHALRNNKSVLYYNMDSRSNIVYNRMKSIIGGVSMPNVELLDENLLNHEPILDNLVISDPKIAEFTIDALYKTIDNVERKLENSLLDLLVIDTLNLMLSNSEVSYSERFFQALSEICDLSEDYDMPIWVGINCRNFENSDYFKYCNDLGVRFIATFDTSNSYRKNLCEFKVLKSESFNEKLTLEMIYSLEMRYDWSTGSIEFL